MSTWNPHKGEGMSFSREMELEKIERRYQYWRKNGICICDAPVLMGEALDRYTDAAIAAERKTA